MRHRWLWLLAVLLTWEPVDPALTVEIEHRHQRTRTILVQTPGTTYTHPYPRPGENCYRVRYVVPQVSPWTAWTCVAVARTP